MEERYPCPKMTPRQWIANFWYYYKWFVLLGLVFVTFITIATVQYFTKVEPDISLLYVGQENLSDANCKKIIAAAEEKVSDVNGDGKVSVNLQSFTLLSDYDLLTPGQKIQAMEKYQGYSDEILSGDGAVLLLDEYFYAELAQNGALVNLYEVFSELPDSATDYFGLRLGDTPLYKKDGFSSLSPDTVLCLKYTAVASKLSALEKAKQDQINRELFRALIG